MLSCEHASRLVSDSMDRRLPVAQRIALKIHLSMCKLCSRYRRQLEFLGEVVHRYAEGLEQGEPLSPVSLSEETRKRMKRALVASVES